MKPRVHSWDLFDTLIGRKCGNALALFEQMAHRLGDPSFVVKRVRAEKELQKRGVEYSLEDIYSPTPSPSPFFQNGEGGRLAEMEFALELENVFPIKRYAERMQAGDIIVSDMYLSEKQLRALMEAAGIYFEGRIFVSCYGKHQGSIWAQIKDEYEIISHCGDNVHNDVQKPARLGIKIQQAHTAMNAVELFYAGLSKELANWVRRARLELMSIEKIEHLNYLQIEFNAPLLWAACQSLRGFVEAEGVRKLLFMSRDGQMFQQMWKRFYAEVDSEYLFISRECLRNGSENYFAYLNERLTDEASLVDIAASCGSLKAALPRLKVESPRIWCLVFLPEPFKVQVEPIRLGYATTNTKTRINNTSLEMLNYAMHWHVKDVAPLSLNTAISPQIEEHDLGGEWRVEFDESGEYDMRKVEEYQRIFEWMVKCAPAPRLTAEEALKVIRLALESINNEGKFLREIFPTHLQFERLRKKKFEEVK